MADDIKKGQLNQIKAKAREKPVNQPVTKLRKSKVKSRTQPE